MISPPLVFSREFPGIAEEVIEHHHEQLLVAEGGQTFRDDEGGSPSRIRRLQPCGNLPDQGAQVNGLPLQLFPQQLRQVQQVIDK